MCKQIKINAMGTKIKLYSTRTEEIDIETLTDRERQIYDRGENIERISFWMGVLIGAANGLLFTYIITRQILH